MRAYRPDYLHVWRTKTYWDTGMLSEEDVESHTFKKLEMRPAIHRSQLESLEKGVAEEMVRFKRQVGGPAARIDRSPARSRSPEPAPGPKPSLSPGLSLA